MVKITFFGKAVNFFLHVLVKSVVLLTEKVSVIIIVILGP